MPLFLGLDIGTSATKAVIIDAGGVVRGAAESPHPIQMPRPGWSEQDPRDWWKACVHSTRNALQAGGIRGRDIEGIGLSGHMHGSVFLPRDADPDSPRVIRPAILWNDQRTAAQCEAITRAVGAGRLLEITGNRVLTGFTAPKLLWLRDHEPDNFAQIGLLLLPKDFIRYQLTGEAAIDVGDASGTLLLDLRSRDWSDEILEALAIDRTILPRVIESIDRAGTLRSAAAEALGLQVGTPVVAGSGDQMTGAVGMGIVARGLVSATLGTSGVVFAHLGAQPFSSLSEKGNKSSATLQAAEGDPSTLQSMCASVPGEYCTYGCMLSAAGALSWFREVCGPGVTLGQLDEEAANVSPGAEGLIFLPYLTGERCPHADPEARGAFIGLTARHTRGHMARAVMEGVAFAMAQMLDLVREARVEASEVRLSGGGARSKLWRQIQSGVYGTPVSILDTSDASACGAALLAGVGCGAWGTVQEACAQALHVRERIEPDPHLVAEYARWRGIYNSLYPTLRGTFRDLG